MENLRYVPVEKKTSEMCSIAVRQNSNNLWYVPEELKTSALLLEAYDVSYHTRKI